MHEESFSEDALTALAYTEFTLKSDRNMCALMEEDASRLLQSLCFVAWAVVTWMTLPRAGVPTDMSWFDVEALRCRDARIDQVFALRAQYWRLAGRRQRFSRRKCRRLAREILAHFEVMFAGPKPDDHELEISRALARFRSTLLEGSSEE